MAVSTGIGFDLSAALAQADKLDKYMDKWAKQSESISANMRQAMTAKANNDMQGFTDALSKASAALSQLSGMKLSPNVDSSKVSELANILSGVIDTMNTMSKLSLFDTQGIYNTNKGLGETSATLSGIRDKISGLKKEWEDMEKFSAPVNKKTGKAFGVNTKTYQQAEADYKASIEKQLQAEIEKEAIAKKELDWAKKTQDEKAAYIQKKLNEILKAEQKNVDEVRREYSRLLSDLGKVETRKKQYAEAESAGKEAGIAVSPEVQTQYQEVLRQEQNLVERKKEIETQYWSEVTDIAERFVLQQSQKEIEEFKRRAQEEKKIYDDEWEKYLKTPEGAMELSDDAKSINEEKEAIKYLVQARDNLSKSTADYDTIIADLNNRIQKHRISVEELTKAEQNENTLQPKIRNEYAQLLKEMDKIAEAKQRLSETKSYKDGNEQAIADMNALDARYNDLAQRRLTIEQNAQGQLDEVVRQHEAARAQESINATIKEEEEKKRIREEYAKKYGAISSTDVQKVIGGSKATENLRQAEKAVQDLKEARAKLNKGDADYKRTLDALNKEITRQEKNIDRIVNAERRRAEAQRLLQQRQTAQRETYAGALEYSRQAKSITELSNSIKYLDAARKKEDLSTKEGRNNYDKLTAVLEKQQKQYDKLTGKMQKNTASLVDTAGQLKRAFTLIFSLSQIRGYFNQLVQIRGEFEMQHRSLQVLLQDQDKANEIWDKTVALAIKSPFRVKDLVTYTKQLAAYRVESDKLYDTTRMLADVSAGLGVDMNRLILAFGQVKAANFLRGCLGYGTPILLYNGDVKEVQDIVIGDKLINENGEIVNVLKLIRGRETMFLVEQVSGLGERVSYRVNRNHILTLWNVQEQQIEDVYVYDYLRNKDAYLGFRVVDGKREYYDIEVTKDRIDDYYGFVLDGNKRFRLSDGTITHNTELRQFSEAGVNMLDELAKKFSEVQGRAVSVGEVFEMVSKRMVSFKDVEEIFQKITSEGGMFYQMQEKQSATLQGMIMNLRDSIDVMLNEIGISSDNTLKKIVSKTKELVDNWRNLMPYVTAAMGAMAGNVTAKSISKIVDLTKEAVKWIKAFHTTRRLATATTPWGLLGTSIGLVTGYIIGLVNKTNEFKAAMNEVENNVRKQLRESIDTYRKLVQTVQDVTKTEKERSTAMSNLKSKYAEILPDMELERDYIEALGTNYDKANQAMFAYYDAKAKAQKKDRIENIYEEDISNRVAKIQSATLRSIRTRGLGGDKMETIMSSYSDAIIADVVEGAKNGLVEIDKIYDEIVERLSKFSGLDEAAVRLSLPSGNWIVWGELQKTLRKRAEALESIPGMIYETYDEQLAADWKNSETEKIHAVMDAYSSLIRVYEKYAKMSDEERSKIIKVDGKEMSQEQAIVADSRKIIGQLPAEMQSYIPLLDDTVKEMIEIARKGSFEFASSTQMMQQAFINSIIPIAEESAKQAEGLGAGAAKRMVDNFLEELGKSATRLDMTDFQNSMIKGIQLISDKFKVNIDEFDKFIPKTEEAVSEIRERLNAEITAMSEELEAWKNSLKPDIEMSEEERSKFMLYDPKKMDDIETRLLPAYKELAQLLGAALKEEKGAGNGGRDVRLEKLKRIIEVIKGMNREYEKLNKTFSSEKSIQDVLSAYKDTIEEIGLDISKIDFTTKAGTADALKMLLGDPQYAADKYALEIRRAFSLVASEVNIAAGDLLNRKLFDRVQEMFDQFDLAKELKGMGFSEGLMNSLFNIEYLDLDELRQKMIDEFSKGAGEQESELLEQLQRGFQDIDWDVVTSILGKDQMEELRKRLEQIGDMVDKQYQEDAKKYLEYARAAIGERAKIKLDELKKIREVEDTFKAREGDSEETLATKANLRQDAIAKIKKESKEAMNKLDWEEFQKSDMFVNLFKDLDNASSALLDHTIKKLHDFKEQWKDMPLEDVRQIVSKLNELEAQLAERSPWKAYAESIEEVRDAMKSVTFESASALSTAQKGGQNNFFAALEQENVFQQEKKDAALEEAHIIETVLRLKQNMATEEDNILATQEEYQSYRKQDIADLEISLAVNQAIADSAQDTLYTNQRLLSNRTKQQKALLKQDSVLKESQQMASDLYGAFKDLSDVLGGSDSPEAIFADMGASMMNTVLNTIQLQIQLKAAKTDAEGLGAAMNTAMSLVGFIVMGVQLLVQAVSAIISYGDKKKQAQLDALARKIEKLQDEFEDLSDAIDNAWTSDEIQKYKSELDAVHEKMIQAQKDKIALLEDSKNVRKGKTDSEEYKEYEAALKALAEMEKGYVDEMANIISTHTAGIFDDGISAARAFTDAWHDSFLETGDGLAGLEDSFDDMLKNLIRQQATLQITGEFAKKWQKELSKYINEDDLELTKEEAQKWSEEVRRTLPALSEALENYLGSFKFSEGESGLSGLQKGIQGITEDTAEIIAAYLDAIRQYVAMQNEQIDMLVSRLDINGEENPMLSHLKIIVTQTTAIKDLLNSLTRGGHSKGGVGLKVFMD